LSVRTVTPGGREIYIWVTSAHEHDGHPSRPP
jgi:hypothetical protein